MKITSIELNKKSRKYSIIETLIVDNFLIKKKIYAVWECANENPLRLFQFNLLVVKGLV